MGVYGSGDGKDTGGVIHLWAQASVFRSVVIGPGCAYL
jgi:hypothetical protein